nr:Gfo/Idh/MocA family oxidoreductase [Candidatus Sigynarchaeota archaeon]
MVEPIKIGFIGGGPRSNSIFNTIVMNRQFENAFEPVAIVDPKPNVTDEWRFKVEHPCTSLDDFLNQDIDAALIISPPATHASIARKCLDAGLHTWSEVPMGLTMDEVFSIIDAEKANKGSTGKYALGENTCWYLGIQLAAKLAREGSMGNLFYMEGEYHHSVEHYMIEENFTGGKAFDPEFHPDTKPTWRATLPPIIYGHTAGPALYVLNKQDKNDRPVCVDGFGNMKMQKRFNNHNFQIAMFQTANDVICKFGSGFVLPNNEVRHFLFWASKCYYDIIESSRKEYFLHLVPEDQARFPQRHQVGGRAISEDEIKAMGVRHAEGGHGGGDPLMFEDWLSSLRCKHQYEMNAIKGAEMTAVGILGLEAIR